MEQDIKSITKDCDNLLKLILSKCKDIKSQVSLLKDKNILFDKINDIEEKIDKIIQKKDEK